MTPATLSPNQILAVTYGLTLSEALDKLPKQSWGTAYPVVTSGRVVGLVSLYEPETWYRPCSGPGGIRAVSGRWQLVAIPQRRYEPPGSLGYSHAVLEDGKQRKRRQRK
jgi:hypothetical protein